jgi:hypothetical protein
MRQQSAIMLVARSRDFRHETAFRYLRRPLRSSGTAHPMRGPELGTNPVIDKEDAKVGAMISSICRGC